MADKTKTVGGVPADTIKDLVESHGLSILEISSKVSLPEEIIVDLIEGRLPIYKFIARKLESSLGFGVDYWLALERRYRKRLKRLRVLSIREETPHDR